MDQTARRYGTRPSQLLGIDDPELALDVDLAICARARGDMRAALDAISEQHSEDGLSAFFEKVVLLLGE